MVAPSARARARARARASARARDGGIEQLSPRAKGRVLLLLHFKQFVFHGLLNLLRRELHAFECLSRFVQAVIVTRLRQSTVSALEAGKVCGTR